MESETKRLLERIERTEAISAAMEKWMRRVFIGAVFLCSVFLSLNLTGLLGVDHQFLSIVTTMIMGVMIIQSTGRKPV